ncbi:hypothetical protein ACFQ08_00545 [Streptosporangium algeriense]|uniref:Toxin-antitoxin system HicB family antitoxin n=1 Tax=Streptosporangium algeriense TaxID=1682748 RepID=A0ABW3DK64_9ACTN
MPNKHKNASVVCRPDRELHQRAKEAVSAVGSDMNAHIIGFLRWLVGDTDELPARPSSYLPKTSVDQQADSIVP